MTGPLICAALFLLVALISIFHARRAPEGWECPRCRGEVIGLDVCPWCGVRRKS